MEVCVVVKPVFSSTVSQKTASQLFIMFGFFNTCDASRVAADEKATRLQRIRSGFKPTASDMTNT